MLPEHLQAGTMTHRALYNMQHLTRLTLLLCAILHLTSHTGANPTKLLTIPSQLYQGDESKYVVGILPEYTIPQEDAEAEQLRKVIMTGINGLKLECLVPDSSLQQSTGGVPPYLTKHIKKPTPSTHTYNAASAQNLISDMARSKPAPTSALPLRQTLAAKFSDGCFEKQIDYWTYKVCPGRTIEQYHRVTHGNNKVEQSMTSVLGHYDSALDEDYTTDATRQQPYYVQHYTKGDNNRQTAVKYICDPGVQQSSQQPQNLLVLVKEPQTYHYEAVIHTSHMCDLLKQNTAAVAGKGNSRVPRRLGYKQRQSAADLTAASAPAAAATDSTDDTAHPHSDLGKALDLLRPLAEDPNCLQLTPANEWWHYHFCYLESVNQVHTEQVAVVPPSATTPTTSPATPQQPTYEIKTIADFDLGHWPRNIAKAYLDDTAQYQWLLEHTSIVKGKTPAESYLKQTYVDGTKCDIGEIQHREVEVRFHCPLQHTDGSGSPQQHAIAAISSVKESSSCRYLMRIDTTLLCEHPTFAPKKPVLHHIVCQPYEPKQ